MRPRWRLVGKGVVFDTGGISLKPAGGMEDMTMDMGGAGVVTGTMKALALRKAKANVVGLVGLVENMPSGNATRPGDRGEVDERRHRGDLSTPTLRGVWCCAMCCGTRRSGSNRPA